MQKISPQPGPQELFLSSSADIVIYGGSAGGGKTYGLLLESLRHIDVKGFGAVIFRRTSPQIRNEGGLWDTSEELFPHVGGTPKESVLMWDFDQFGTSVKFAHLEHEKNKLDYQGAQIPLIEFDELTHFTQSQFFYMLSRNRSTCGVKPYIRATTNPDADSWLVVGGSGWGSGLISWWINEDGFPITDRSGVIRWFIRVNDELIWADSPEEIIQKHPESIPKSLTFIEAKLKDNIILEEKDPGYRANLMALPRVERERLLGGNWKVRPAAGMYFRREWFEIVERTPTGYGLRNWDLAATEPTSNNPSPDWTAGLKLVEREGTTYISDLRHVQKKPAGVEKLVVHTASVDGAETEISMEQEPGSSGKITIDHYARLLKGHMFSGVPSTKAKELRAGPVSSAAENGLIKVVRADWNEKLFDELESFPEGEHDDIVDALSGAFNKLAEKAKGNYAGFTVPAAPRRIPGYGSLSGKIPGL